MAKVGEGSSSPQPGFKTLKKESSATNASSGEEEDAIVGPLDTGIKMAVENHHHHKSSSPPDGRRFFRADDHIPIKLAILFGFQQVMVCVSALLVVPFLLSDLICPGRALNELRTCLGMRLALLQGTAFAYIPSIQTFIEAEYGSSNYSYPRCINDTSVYVPPEIIDEKLGIIQGSLLASSIVPMIIAATGLVGKLTKFIGPLTVSPLILLLVISSMEQTIQKVEQHWVAVIQALSLFATTLYLADIRVPLPGWKDGKFRWYHVHLFGQYPYLIAITFSWVFCVALTVFNLVPYGSAARTDKPENLAAIQDAPWVRVPYPGQFGSPRFRVGLFCGFLVSAMTSVFESVGDYHAIARISQERSPPSHAINRGILAEAFGSFLSGLLGPGVGLTTHTENIGVIGITRIASRRSLVIAGIWLIGLGLFTKVGAVLSTIPDPLVGGVLASSMAMVSGVAVANVQAVDLKNSRNMGIIGFALVCGLVIPGYFKAHRVDTGFLILDQALQVLLTLNMFVGAMVACILDNTVPGATREERGLKERGVVHDLGPTNRDIYLYPKTVMDFIDRHPWLKLLPITPKSKYHPTTHNHASPFAMSFNNGKVRDQPD